MNERAKKNTRTHIPQEESDRVRANERKRGGTELKFIHSGDSIRLLN